MPKAVIKKYEVYIWTPITTQPKVVGDFKLLVDPPPILAEMEANVVLFNPTYKENGTIVLAVKTGSKPWSIGAKSNIEALVSAGKGEAYSWGVVEKLYIGVNQKNPKSNFYVSPDDAPFSVSKPKSSPKYAPKYTPKPKTNAYPTNSTYSPYVPKVEPTVFQANKEGKWVKCRLDCSGFPAISQKIKGLQTRTTYLEEVVNLSSVYSGFVITEDKGLTKTHEHSVGSKYDFWGRMDDKQLVTYLSELKWFVRPCPQNPEHGFVDSRVVSSEGEARKIIREVRETGEVPEFIVMEKMDCEYSAVINPDRITFGRSNDGATQGNGAVEIVLSVGKENEVEAREKFWTGVEWPYAEMLYVKGEVGEWGRLVQLRAGPKLSGGEVKKVKVSEVYKVDPTMELIPWGKEVKILKGKVEKIAPCDVEKVGYNEIAPVVWHEGGALGSHFGVHCKTSEGGSSTLAYITSSTPPKVGDVIEVGKVNKAELESVREGLLLGLAGRKNEKGDAVVAVIENRKRAVEDLKNFLGALHIYSLADMGDKNTAKAIGYAWGLGLRVIGALPLGEARHKEKMRKKVGQRIITRVWEKNQKGKKGSIVEKSKEKLESKLSQWTLQIPEVRDTVYHKAWALDFDVLFEALLLCYDGFMPYGGMGWQGGYGGVKWGNCTKSLLRCYDKVEEFLKSGDEKTLNQLVEEINVMVNEAHNGGWWLNKLIQHSVLDSASELPQFLISPKRAYESKETVLGVFNRKMLAIEVLEGFDKARKRHEEEDKLEKKAKEEEEKAKEMVKKMLAEEIKKNDGIGTADDVEPSFVEVEKPKVYESETLAKVPEMVNKAIEELLSGKEGSGCVYAQYKISGGSLHYQVACKQINRVYGYANNSTVGLMVGKVLQGFKWNGKELWTLTGSKSSTYKPFTLYKGEEEGMILFTVEKLVDNAEKGYGYFMDFDLWSNFAKAGDDECEGEELINAKWYVKNVTL